MENGELGAITNGTNYLTNPNSFKKLKLQDLGGWHTCLVQINSTLAEN